jgi:hypothetical protein
MHTKQYYDCQWYNRTVLDCAYALEEVAMWWNKSVDVVSQSHT